MTKARLLLCTAPHRALSAALTRHLSLVEAVALSEVPAGPWPLVEAVLTGGATDELPDLVEATVPRLRFVQRVFTGMDGFPFDRFPRGVRFAGNVGAYAPFVAEQALALLLSIAKRLGPNLALLKAGRLRPAVPARTLSGKTALLLGYGEIAAAIADRLRPFGVTIVGLNRTGVARPGCARMFAASELSEALASAEIVIDCRPLTVATASSLGAAELARLKEGALFVNVGRAGTVDEAALYDHLKSHPETYAAFDPWWHEDFAAGETGSRFPFFDLPNFYGSPHSAGITEGARERAYDLAAANLARYFAGETPHGLVDPSDYARATPSPETSA